MPTPKDILAVPRPKNTVVVTYGKGHDRYAVRRRVGCRYVKGRHVPVTGPTVGHIVGGAFVPLEEHPPVARREAELKDWAVIELADRCFADVFGELWRELIVADIFWRHLRDFMILTVQATEITTRTGDRQTLRTWMEMIQRFLLDGIDGQRTRFAIDFADKHAIMIPATATKARLAIGHPTMVRTKQALYPIPFKSLIIITFVRSHLLCIMHY